MKSAVLVIDVQSILFDPPPQPFERNEVLTR
ncbi:cysteine hydrolase, partial [Vibrio cholerae]